MINLHASFNATSTFWYELNEYLLSPSFRDEKYKPVFLWIGLWLVPIVLIMIVSVGVINRIIIFILKKKGCIEI